MKPEFPAQSLTCLDTLPSHSHAARVTQMLPPMMAQRPSSTASCASTCVPHHTLLQQPLLMFHYPSAASCQLTVKMSGDDMICFPIHSSRAHAGTALKIYQISTRALLPVLEDGLAPAFPAGPTLAWLPPAAQAGHCCHPPPSQVTGKESLCNKSPSITCPTTLCRGAFTSSPVPHVSLLPNLACPSSPPRAVCGLRAGSSLAAWGWAASARCQLPPAVSLPALKLAPVWRT